MKNPKYPFIALGAYLALIGTLAVTTARPAYTQGNGRGGPDVRVVNTPAEPVPVTLQGAAQIDTSTPLPVREVDNPNRVPFQIELTREESEFEVPAGKRLVIEHVSGEYNTDAPRSFVSLGTTSGDPPLFVEHHFVPEVTGTFNGFSDHLFSLAARLYANPGTVVRAFGGGATSLSVAISGYLVDVD